MSILKKFSSAADKIYKRITKKLCMLFGHRWLYKSYSNYIQANGEKYDFKASRSCTRCQEHAYYYTEWKVEPRSTMDFQSDYFSVPEIEINKVVYS